MKKAFCLLIIFALLATLSIPVFAEKSVVITATITEAYEITIPEATTLTFGVTTAQNFGTVGLTSARLIPGHQVTIEVSGAEGLVNSLDNSKKILYTIKDGENAFSSANFTDTTLKTLTIVVEQAQWDAAPAGNYSDTVTFTSAVTNIIG